MVCSFFEIYNEVIFDLINPPVDKGKLGGGLQIKEHPVPEKPGSQISAAENRPRTF